MHSRAIDSGQIHINEMQEGLFSLFSNFVYKTCGVKMPPSKKSMLAGRISKRLRRLGMASYEEYFDYVTSPSGRKEELSHMIDVVTTHKTDFIREPAHFEFLMSQSLPTLARTRRISNYKKLNVWSAGCSSGEEPYSLCIFLAEFFNKIPGDFSVLATDISEHVLTFAKQGIYPKNAVEPIPFILKRKYLLRGKGTKKGFFRIVPELRKRVIFQRLNLNSGRNFGIKIPMDIIFCRNVIIYFDLQTQIRLFEKFYSQLAPGGYIFIGHSETLHNINDKFIPVSTAVYRKPE